MNFNISPYFDDFDPKKNYHQILFRPGFPVQSRELTQSQSLLQDQIKKFGNHIFKNGTVVTGGDTAFNAKVKAVRATAAGTYAGDLADLVGKEFRGETSKVKGICIHYEANIFYVLFTANGEDDSTKNVFQNNEFLSYWDAVDSEYETFAETISSGSVTPATIATIQDGVFYWGGYFITCNKQNIVLSSTSASASSVVTLDISESIVDDVDDETLRDPALGYSNENAPGAHRYKLDLVLAKHSSRETLGENSIILFELVNGNIERLYNTTEYADIMKMLARRTYEESGNYTAEEYKLDLTTHASDSSKFMFNARNGVSFIGGYEVNNKINKLTTSIDKARTSLTKQNMRIVPSVGNYVNVCDAYLLPANFSYIQLRDDTISVAGTPVGNIIGVAKVRYVDSSSTGVNDTYKLFLFDVEFFGGKSWNNVASFDAISTAGAASRASGNILKVLDVINPSGSFNTTNEIVDQVTATNVVIPVYYDSSLKQIFVKKKPGAYSWVPDSSFIKQSTSLITGTVRTSYFIAKPSTIAPIFNIPADVVKNTSDYIYTVKKQITSGTISGGIASFTLPASTLTNGTSAIGFISNGVVLENVTIPNATNTFGVSGLGAYNGMTLTLSINVEKSFPTYTYRNKTYNSSYSLSGVAPATRIKLGTQDAYSLVSVTTSTGIDVTSEYTLVNNSSDCIYQGSYLQLKQTAKLRTGITLTIICKILANGTGDFATVDSYSGLGTDYVVNAGTYKSSTKVNYSLGKTFDFRSLGNVNAQTVRASITQNNATVTLLAPFSTGTLSVGLKVFFAGIERTISSITNDLQLVLSSAFPNTAEFTNSNAVLVIGYNASFKFVDDGVSDPIADSMPITFDYEYYVPRRDLLCIGSDGKLKVYKGRPSDKPTIPVVEENDTRMYLAALLIPAYTPSLKSVSISKFDRPGYTMEEINHLAKRLEKVEEVTLLSLLEQQTASQPVIDPTTGLDRFKSGFVVESFNDHRVIDLEDQSFGEIDDINKTFSCWTEDEDCQVVLVTGSSNVLHKDKLVMLDYTQNQDLVIVNQPMASDFMNINPFTWFKWNGAIKLTPSEDFWTEVKKNQTVTTQKSVSSTRTVRATAPQTTVANNLFPWLRGDAMNIGG